MFVDNIENLTLENNNFRQVISTAKNMQLVLMTLKPKEEIGLEIHPDTDQFFRIEKGNGILAYGNEKDNLTEKEIADGSAILIPMGTWHNIVNTDAYEPLKLYTIYSPPHHADKLTQQSKPQEGGYYAKYIKYKKKYSKLKAK